ncbi:MAG: two-component system sensor histidine kinase NtrB [Candidatus Polarisedimenticolia bacterium]
MIWANEPMLVLAGAGPSGEWPGEGMLDCFAADPDLPSMPGSGGILSSRTGSRRWFRSILVPWGGGALNLLADCTAEVLAERERQRRDVYLSRAVEDSVDAILSLDNDGRIQYWNHGAERMFRYTAAEVLGRPYELLVPEALALEGELDRIAEIIDRQGDLRNFETVRLARDGRTVEVDISVTQIRDETGRALGRSVIYRDISLRRRLEEEQTQLREELSRKVSELREANRTLRRSQEKLLSMEKLSAIGEMAAKVAHEIRTPLVTIGGFSNTLWKSMPADAPQREYLTIIRDEVRRLEDIVAEILDYVRPGPPETERCDVNHLVQDAVRPHLEQIHEAGIRLEIQLEPGLPVVHVNRTQIRQVLTNLIVNAMQAVRDRPQAHEPRVGLTTGTGLNHVVISVSDNGTGIPQRHKERVFRAFFTTKPGGSGLGLAIASQIAAQHRGTLTFDSDPGHGTTFHLRLPCGAPPTGSLHEHEDDPGG